MTATADRVRRLAAQLDEPPQAVAATLRDELTRALADIDAGLADADRERVEDATHAARNSVLMLDAPRMLSTLRELDDAAQDGDAGATELARARLAELWDRLGAELSAV